MHAGPPFCLLRAGFKTRPDRCITIQAISDQPVALWVFSPVGQCSCPDLGHPERPSRPFRSCFL